MIAKSSRQPPLLYLSEVSTVSEQSQMDEDFFLLHLDDMKIDIKLCHLSTVFDRAFHAFLTHYYSMFQSGFHCRFHCRWSEVDIFQFSDLSISRLSAKLFGQSSPNFGGSRRTRTMEKFEFVRSSLSLGFTLHQTMANYGKVVGRIP